MPAIPQETAGRTAPFRMATSSPVVVVLAVMLLAACSRTEEVPLASAGIVVSGDPAHVYERALPEIRMHVSEGTNVVRVDEPGAITMRFSVNADDRSVRLVEVRLAQRDDASTEVSVRSSRFAFLIRPVRDAEDLAVESRFIELIRSPAP